MRRADDRGAGLPREVGGGAARPRGAFAWSSRAVGSSASRSAGRAATARATATRSRWPLERSETRRPAAPARPTAASDSAARPAASSASTRRSERPSSTFSAAVRKGTSPASWLTSPTLSAGSGPARRGRGPRPPCPRTTTSPSVGRSSPASRRRSVVLPEPDGPVTAVSLPPPKVAVSSASAVRAAAPSPYVRETSRPPRRSASAAGAGPGSPPACASAGARAPAAAWRRMPCSCRRADACEPDPRPPEQLLREAEPAAATDDDRLVPAVGERGLLAHAAVADADDAIGDRRGLRVVADEHGRRAGVAGELGDRLVDEPGVRGVELAGRLVGQQEPRPVRERGADRHALLLAARELARARARPVEEPHPLEQLARPGASRSRRVAPASPSCSPTSSLPSSSAASARQ